MSTATPATLPQAFQSTAARVPDRVALRDGTGTELTWAQYAERVKQLAGGLAKLGVKRGDTVAIMATNSPDFHVADAAALHLGATTVSVYATLPPEDIAWELEDAGARVAVIQAACLEQMRGAREQGPIEQIVLLDGTAENTIPADELIADADPAFDFDAAWQAVEPTDVAVLIYTSGTTGNPKGVELTHAAIIGNLGGMDDALGAVDGARVISTLPMAHIAERQFSHYRPMLHGFTTTCCTDPKQLPKLMVEVRPHYFFAPPRLFEKMRSAIEPALKGNGNGKPDPTVATALLERIGFDQIASALTGAAPVPPELVQFWNDLGLPLTEGWGLSECGAFGAFGRPNDHRVGTVGKPLPGVELKLLDDGEILLRSPYVMRGYRNLPQATAETIDDDGWLHTGDVGTLDDDGYLSIIDRKKELIINAAGKNMSPANIEAKLRESHELIGQACVVGNGRRYNVALLVLDPETSKGFTGDVDAAVAEGVERANARLSRVEQIKKYVLLDAEWEPGGDELTPTMKLKRKPIEAKYDSEIESLYA